jgi:hypothetical protein
VTTTVVRRAQAEQARIRAATVAEAVRIWTTLGGVTEQDLERFVAAVTPVVRAGQQMTADTVAAMMSQLGGVVVGAPSIDRMTLRGVDAAEVYARPVVTARTGLSQGKEWAVAMREAQQRLTTLVATDTQIAKREAALDIMTADARVVGYRRVLTGASCALCATASTQRYTVERLMPIHDHCDCEVAPIIGDRDPGRVINQDLLRDLRSEGGPSYWNDRGLSVDADGTVTRTADEAPLVVTEHVHGELGPVLADAEHAFAEL